MNIDIFSLTHSSSTKSWNKPKLQCKKKNKPTNKQKSGQINSQLNSENFKYDIISLSLDKYNVPLYRYQSFSKLSTLPNMNVPQ